MTDKTDNRDRILAAVGVLAIIAIIVTVSVVLSRGSSSDYQDMTPARLDDIHQNSQSLVFGNPSADEQVDVVLEPMCPACHEFMGAYITRSLKNRLHSGKTVLRIYPVSYLSSNGSSDRVITAWYSMYIADTSDMKMDSLNTIVATLPRLSFNIMQPDLAEMYGVKQATLTDPDTMTAAGKLSEDGKIIVHMLPKKDRATPIVIRNGTIITTSHQAKKLVQGQ